MITDVDVGVSVTYVIFGVSVAVVFVDFVVAVVGVIGGGSGGSEAAIEAAAYTQQGLLDRLSFVSFMKFFSHHQSVRYSLDHWRLLVGRLVGRLFGWLHFFSLEISMQDNPYDQFMALYHEACFSSPIYDSHPFSVSQIPVSLSLRISKLLRKKTQYSIRNASTEVFESYLLYDAIYWEKIQCGP